MRHKLRHRIGQIFAVGSIDRASSSHFALAPPLLLPQFYVSADASRIIHPRFGD
ncbi:hypothetical protein IL54_1916 [Sphingobium sp. ba1]|nr:hypothetical protein IL54_1916 [Sphingobium sp. ba1]